MKSLLAAVVALTWPALASADSTWVLDSSLIAYHADHPFHNTVGKTANARGKGVCTQAGCDFLVAAPVKTFDSGDTNRDLHMLQAVNGGQYPLVSVKTHVDAEPSANGFTADLTVDFGGKQTVYPKVPFQVMEKTADHFKAKGQIPLLLSNHNVKRPSLMGVAIKDSAPVDVETAWRLEPQKAK